MNWFKKIIKSKSTGRAKNEFHNALHAFILGEKIWKDVALSRVPPEFRKEKTKEALKYFDEAILKGYNESEVFSLRGSCSNDLGYYFDALEDYNIAIQNNPQKGIANNYFMRSLIKDSIYDYDGSLADIKEAIRLSKLDNEDTKYWNNYAKTTGFRSAADFYEGRVNIAERKLELEKMSPTTVSEKNIKLEKIKRR